MTIAETVDEARQRERELAFGEGRRAQAEGLGRDTNPYHREPDQRTCRLDMLRHAWEWGWDTGSRQPREGAHV